MINMPASLVRELVLQEAKNIFVFHLDDDREDNARKMGWTNVELLHL